MGVGASGQLEAAERAHVLDVFLRDPAAHAYGIADVVQLWERSRWWRQGDAVAGVLELPGAATPVVYAVSAGAGPATLDLLARLAPDLPDRFVVHGPRGTSARLAPAYGSLWARDYVKMHLADASGLPPPDPRARVLGRGDLPALERLFSTDPIAGDFFHEGLLDTRCYVGIGAGPGTGGSRAGAAGSAAPGAGAGEAGGASELVACAGVHVIDEAHGVAAIGNVATHPAHRRAGLGRAVTATLCHLLRERVATIALNVRGSNGAAGRLYASLGFRTVLPYEEAELMRHPSPS